MTGELFVGNLSPGTAATDLEQAFAPWGGRDAVVVLDSQGQPEGYGFITLDVSLMATAIDTMNGARIEGRAVTVYGALWRNDQAEYDLAG